MLLLLCGCILLLFLLQVALQRSQSKRIALCAAGAVVMFGISASKKYFSDLEGYVRVYNTLSGFSYADFFEQWKNGIFKDGFFYLFGKVFADLGFGDRIWIGFIALIFAFCFAFLVYKHSKQPFMSILILFVLFYSFTLTALRQTLALAVVFVAYHFAVMRKVVLFLVCIGIACLFHSSALIVLPVYWIMKLKLGWKHLIAIGASLIIALFFPTVYRSLIENLAWNETLASYADSEIALSWAGYIIQFFIVMFCVYFRNGWGLTKIERKRDLDSFINCMIVGLCIQSFATVIAESFRLSLYYSICSVTAVPNVIAGQKNTENKGMMYFAVGMCLVLYLFWSGAYNDLAFFWQK